MIAELAKNGRLGGDARRAREEFRLVGVAHRAREEGRLGRDVDQAREERADLAGMLAEFAKNAVLAETLVELAEYADVAEMLAELAKMADLAEILTELAKRRPTWPRCSPSLLLDSRHVLGLAKVHPDAKDGVWFLAGCTFRSRLLASDDSFLTANDVSTDLGVYPRRQRGGSERGAYVKVPLIAVPGICRKGAAVRGELM